MQHLAYGAVGLVLWLVGNCLYNIYFHPLRAIPGPFLARISRWWLFTLEMRGNPHVEILELHRKYGTTYDQGHHPEEDDPLTRSRADAEALA